MPLVRPIRYRAFLLAPPAELLRALFHGAVKAMLSRLQEFADFQKVAEAEVLVNQYVEESHDVTDLKHTLAHIMLGEDAELHMFQVLEAAFRHHDVSSDPEERRVHLLAATRYSQLRK